MREEPKTRRVGSASPVCPCAMTWTEVQNRASTFPGLPLNGLRKPSQRDAFIFLFFIDFDMVVFTKTRPSDELSCRSKSRPGMTTRFT